MNENNTILTDENMAALLDTVNESVKNNPDLKLLQDMKSDDFDPSEIDRLEMDEPTIVKTINPITGLAEGTAVAGGLGLDSESDIFNDFLSAADENIDLNNLDIFDIESAIKNDQEISSSDSHNISIAEFETIKNLLMKRNSGSTIKYSEMPNFLKDKINKLVQQYAGRGMSNQTNMMRNAMATSIIEQIYTDIIGDKIQKVCIDLDTSIKNIAKAEISEINTLARKKYHHTFVNQFPELAEHYAESDPKKSELLLKISEGYNQSCTLDDMYTAYTNGKIRVKHIDIEKYKRVFNEFNMKYEKSTMTIKDILTTPDILNRHVNKRFSMKTINTLIVVFCKYCSNMKPVNVDEHTFMYYFINNIVSLDMYDENNIEEKKFYDDFINTINKFLSAIDNK